MNLRFSIRACCLVSCLVGPLGGSNAAHAQVRPVGEVRDIEQMMKAMVAQDRRARLSPESVAENSTAEKSDQILLQEYRIESTRESLGQFLDDLIPNEQSNERAERLISQLGHPEFEVREMATAELTRLPGIPQSMFDKILGGDPEVDYRAQQILQTRDSSEVARLQIAVLRTLGEQKITGLTNKLLDAFPQLSNSYARRMASRVIVVTCQQDDIGLLKQYLDDNDPELVVTVLKSLIRLEPNESVEFLEQTAKSESEEVKLESAILFAQLRNPRCLDLFVELLASSSISVRGRAFSMLRGITKAEIEYKITIDPVQQAASIAKWKSWVREHGDEIEINLVQRVPRLGRILVGVYPQRVVELDMKGNVIWEAEIENAFACHGLPNGHRLISQYSLGKLLEYDENGKLVKEFANISATVCGVQRLENGNTLIAGGQASSEIMEIDPEGKTLWKKNLPGTIVDVESLESGLMLVSFNGTKKVAELDRDGKVHWEIDVDKDPFSASRLMNGNTLVSSKKGGIVEYDRTGKKVREFESGQNTYVAQEMEDGNLVYADMYGIHIIDAAGKKVWSDTTYTGILFISYY